jgi:hypothetical protein
MTSLQLGLIAAGVVLVAGVIIYNWLQERRIRRRIEATFRKPLTESPPDNAATRKAERVEPTFSASDDGEAAAYAASEDSQGSDAGAAGVPDAEWEPPVETKARIVSELSPDRSGTPSSARAQEAPREKAPEFSAARATIGRRGAPQPDPDIECMVTLQPVRGVTAGALAAGLHARLGKPLRWFGRRDDAAQWQLLKSDTTGEFTEIAACLLLADRSGAATQPLLDGFARLAGDVASSLPAAYVPPDTAREAARAETLDRICADLDVQIGLTLLKAGPATIPGTRLRGVAEAAGFRLAEGGRFDWVQEETGAVLFSLTNYRSEPFTADALRAASTPGAVFLLDVPRVTDPVRVFDQMKLAARRMAQTLDATLVDDNRRPLDDAAFAAIREQVQATAVALRDVHIDPGGPRALALFGG